MKMEKSPQELRLEREKRINDVIRLKVPDRVPIVPSFGYFPARYAGITCEDAFFDLPKWTEACKKVALDFAPDLYFFASIQPGPVQIILGNTQLLLPGHGTSPYHTHQFVEGEYMKAEEWDAFLSNPADFIVRVFTPRVYQKLRALAGIPPLNNLVEMYGIHSLAEAFAQPDIAAALATLQQAGEEIKKWKAHMASLSHQLEALGFIPAYQSIAMAPFDLISDVFRGMRGSMLDMYRNPDKLLAACEWLLPDQIRRAIESCKRTGNPRIFIALHRGAEGFMSLKQFEIFYWPFLKRLIVALADAGLVPCPYFEGDYTSRLEYLLELPRGKVIAHFDTTNIFRAKEVLGNHICIRGNMPVSLLQAGTPQEVKDYTKKLIDVVGRGGGFIMSSRSFLDEADPALVKVWVDFTREYGVYR
jgi:uroporphyrinogen-III decarboxylase